MNICINRRHKIKTLFLIIVKMIAMIEFLFMHLDMKCEFIMQLAMAMQPTAYALHCFRISWLLKYFEEVMPS